MRRSVPKSLLLIAIAFVVGTVHAQTVNWKYVEGGWLNFDPDAGSSEDGLFLGGAVDLGKAPFHLYGQFGDIGDLDLVQVGGGWHGLLGERADLFADGAFYDIDVEDGFKVRFGVRWMVSQRLELNGNLAWTELDFSDNRSAAANGIFDLTKRLGVGGGFEWGDNFSVARIFARFNFGPRG
jgi:hypothetical protein